jgi:hypothetical protein
MQSLISGERVEIIARSNLDENPFLHQRRPELPAQHGSAGGQEIEVVALGH